MRRWKIAAVAGWACAGLLLLAGAKAPGTLRCQHLFLEDEKGQLCAELNAVNGDAALTFRGPSGARLLGLGVRGGQTLLVIRDPATGNPALSAATVKGEPTMVFSDPKTGDPRVTLGVAGGQGLMLIEGEKGNIQATLP